MDTESYFEQKMFLLGVIYFVENIFNESQSENLAVCTEGDLSTTTSTKKPELDKEALKKKISTRIKLDFHFKNTLESCGSYI